MGRGGGLSEKRVAMGGGGVRVITFCSASRFPVFIKLTSSSLEDG